MQPLAPFGSLVNSGKSGDTHGYTKSRKYCKKPSETIVSCGLSAMWARICRRFGNRNSRSRAAVTSTEQPVSRRFLASHAGSTMTTRAEWIRTTFVVLSGTCCTALLCKWLTDEAEDVDYGDVQYWLSRYQDSWYQQPYDWLGSFISLKPWIQPAAGKGRVVHLGCGTSRLAEEMFDSGDFGEIWNVDVSEVCLEVMRQRNEQLRPQLRWVKADLRDMSSGSDSAHRFEDSFFDCAIDKSTLDSICDCGRDADADKYIAEVARVLKPSGVLLVFSFSPPHARMRHLRSKFNCEVEVAEGNCFVYTCRRLSQ